MGMGIEVKGLVEATRKLEQVANDLHGEPMTRAMKKATLLVTKDAKINAPVDTGRLRASITPEVRGEGKTVIGVVGSNVIYAPYMETGTKPHFPPLSALQTWAKRHGTTAYVVARAIARRGIKGRKYLQRAFEQNRTAIRDLLGKAVKGIVEK